MKKIFIWILCIGFIFIAGCARNKSTVKIESKTAFDEEVEYLNKLPKEEFENKIKEIFGIASSGDVKYYGKDEQIQAKKVITALKEKSVPFLISKINSYNVREALGGIELLTSIDKYAVNDLIATIKDLSVDPVVIRRSINILAEIGDKKAVNPIYDKLFSSDAGIKASAIYAMWKFNEKKAIPEILKALNDDNPSVVRRAVVVLGDFKETKAIPDLVKLLGNENYSIRYPAANSLIKIGDSAVDDIIKGIDSGNQLAKYQIIECLGRIKNRKAVDPLIKMLYDSDFAVRGFAVEALDLIGDPKALRDIIKLRLDEKNPFVLEKVKNCIKLK